MEYKVFIVIVTYNGKKFLPKCLSALYESTYGHEVIVVDNNSTDGTAEYIRDEHSSIALIKNIDNRGFGGANNQGISIALTKGADFVFLVNQDVYLHPECIRILLDTYDSCQSDRHKILSPVHLNSEGNDFDRAFSSYIQKGNPGITCQNITGKNCHRSDFINAAAWMIPRQIILDIGGFGDLFYHYGEDLDYVNRARYAGYKIYVASRASVIHDRSTRFTAVADSSNDERLFHVYSLSVLSNVNRPLLVTIMELVIRLAGAVIKNISKPAKSISYVKGTLSAVIRIRAIFRYRKRVLSGERFISDISSS